ncbi:hypothetical protein ACJX0J_032362, partial [Zea mays]
RIGCIGVIHISNKKTIELSFLSLSTGCLIAQQFLFLLPTAYEAMSIIYFFPKRFLIKMVSMKQIKSNCRKIQYKTICNHEKTALDLNNKAILRHISTLIKRHWANFNKRLNF